MEEEIKKYITNQHSRMTWDIETRSFIVSESDFNLIAREAVLFGREQMMMMAVEVVKIWKNEGENPTEADLVLENVLKALGEIK